MSMILFDAQTLNTLRLVYIISVSVLGAVLLFIVTYFPIRKVFIKKKYVEHYYKEIYKVAINNDYFLINNFIFKVDDSSLMKINHILFGDKYVYLINDFHYEGDIVGRCFDKSLVCFSKKGRKYYVDNPILKNKFLLERLCMMTGLDSSIMIGISLVNDDCNSEIKSESKQYYLVSRNRFSALIKAIESRPISKLNEKSLEKLVQSINKMNRKKKNTK